MVVVLHIGAWTALFCLFHWYRNVITSQLWEFSCSQAQSKYSCNSHQHLCTVLIIGGDLPSPYASREFGVGRGAPKFPCWVRRTLCTFLPVMAPLGVRIPFLIWYFHFLKGTIIWLICVKGGIFCCHFCFAGLTKLQFWAKTFSRQLCSGVLS